MWESLIAIIIGSFGIGSALHALLHKRDPRSTLGWTVVCVMLPFVGAAAYWVLGVNRIKTRARAWQEGGRFKPGTERTYAPVETNLAAEHPQMARTMSSLVLISERVTKKPLIGGNHVEPLFNGEIAYPKMLEAIEQAQRSVYLCTYLFDTDEAGRRFIDKLATAASRGVDVRVLVDAIGERYSRPRASKLLRKRSGVKVATFLPITPTLKGLRINLRNHRKLLITDGHVGFTGGMNIGQRHMVEDANNRHKTQDVHFRVTGPAVYALEDMFFEDWYFTTGQHPPSSRQEVPEVEPTGTALCRPIPDGPNEDFEALQWILVGALSCAQKRVQIMTPYFIPSRELLAALNAASLRGVRVDVILPRDNNLPFVAWAAQAMLAEVLQYGTRVYYQPPPFNHSKLLIVDEFYVVLGSANLDPRSLRLNFEFNLEVYDPALAAELSAHFERVRRHSQPITMEELEARSLLIKFRDAVTKLAAPYL